MGAEFSSRCPEPSASRLVVAHPATIIFRSLERSVPLVSGDDWHSIP
jgi:hypothetical protein